MVHAPAALLAFVLSPWQLLVALVIVLLIFGNRIPEMMRSLGRSMTEFKKGVREAENDEGDAPKIDRP